jgi:Pyruvate/2-oxoacid:ferredoxin oxidoreductase delta subunit
MAENVLKKEFKEKDIQRLRNLVQGKYGEKATMGTGYTKKQEFYEEGDIWEEDGRTWTIKDGIKQNVTRLDKAKESLHLPLFCPGCNTLMNHKFDKRFYIQYHRCYSCQVKFETDLKVKGLWDEYEKFVTNSDIDGLIYNFNIWIDEEIESSNQSWVTEAGDIEKWNGSSKDKLLQNKEETIKYLESLKK